MIAKCPYAKTVWHQGGKLVGTAKITTSSSCNEDNRLVEKSEPSNLRATVIVYTAWNLGKERCRRVFDNEARNEQQLVAAINDDVQALQHAWVESEEE